MKIERPQFELTRTYADGTQEAPEIVPVTRLPWDTTMERRGFLGVGAGIAAVLLLVDGKATAETASEEAQLNFSINPGGSPLLQVPARLLNAHRSSVNALAISADGKTLASGSGDETIKIWSLPGGNLLSTHTHTEGRTNFVYALALSPDGKLMASSYPSNTAKLWSLPAGRELTTLGEYLDPLTKLAISPDGRLLISGASDAMVKLWSLPEGKRLTALTGHKNSINALAISPDGKTLASGDGDGIIKLWSLPTGKLLTSLPGHRNSVNALAISPDGRLLVSGSWDQTIKLWSLPEGRLLTTLTEHRGLISSLAISPGGKTLASSSADKTIKLWSLPDGKLLTTLEGHTSAVNALVITADGRTLASGDGQGVIILWDFEKRSFLGFLFDPKANASDAIAYNAYDSLTGRTITYTLPCGSPIPAGAVCTCNCVRGTYREPVYEPPFRSEPRPTNPPPTPSGGRVVCTCDKVCTCIPVPSDRNVKEAFATADPLLILQRLSELPIQTWNYKWNDAAIRHIGPMAQDFAAAFAVGEDDKHICPVDAQGVAFAAIQGLYRIVREKEALLEEQRSCIENLQHQLGQQQRENRGFKARIEAVEGLLKAAAMRVAGEAH